MVNTASPVRFCSMYLLINGLISFIFSPSALTICTYGIHNNKFIHRITIIHMTFSKCISNQNYVLSQKYVYRKLKILKKYLFVFVRKDERESFISFDALFGLRLRQQLVQHFHIHAEISRGRDDWRDTRRRIRLLHTHGRFVEINVIDGKSWRLE